MAGGKNRLAGRLIYPVPQSRLPGWGYMSTSIWKEDAVGSSTEYVDNIDYAVDERNKKLFYESIRSSYLHGL